MAIKYLNDTGLAYFFGKLKALFATKDVATQSTDGLLSASDKAKLDGLDQLISSASGESVATSNCSGLESVVVHGKAVQNGTPTPSVPVPIQVVEAPNFLDTSLAHLIADNTPGTWTGNSYSYRGITVVVNNDGTLTLSGTATGTFTFYIEKTDLGLSAGDYHFVCCPSGGSASTYYARLTTYNSSNSTVSRIDDIGNGVSLSISSIEIKQVAYIHLTKYDSFTTPVTIYPMLNPGSSAIPFGSIGLKVNSAITPIDLQGNALASLPDGTKDELTVDSVGHCVLVKRVSYTDQAVTDGVTGTVGTDVLSSTGAIANGADVYYKAASSTTTDLGYIDTPTIADGSVISITAYVAPTITCSWWTDFAQPIANAIQCLKNLILQQS